MKTILSILLLALALPSCNSAAGDDAPIAGDHQSTAIIQIHADEKDLQAENFIANEIASISMGEVAKVASLNLEKISASTIQRSIKVERIAGTDMVRISASSDSADQPKQIVNAVIRAYMEIRGSMWRNTAETPLKALDNEIIAQSDLVQDNRNELTVLIQQYGIPYFEDQSSSPIGTTEMELYHDARKKLAAMEIELALLKTKVETLPTLKNAPEAPSTHLTVLTKQVEEMRKITADRQSETIELSLKQNRYLQSVRAFQQSLALLTEMKDRQQRASLALKMPRFPITLRQKAE